MRIGIPREIKILEGRVGLVPEAAAELIHHGHEVYLEHNAGVLSGYTDEQFEAVGVQIVPDARSLYEVAELVIKVKEPQAQELELLRSDHLLFCYLHLAAEPALMRGLTEIGLTAVAFETVTDSGGGLPLLAPMSDIAGRIAVQSGANLLQHIHGGKGLLLGGLPAADRGHVVIVGAGMAGGNAALMAAAMGARVTVFDRDRHKLAAMRDLGANVTALYPYQQALEQSVSEADLLIGAVLIPGAKAPHLVSRKMVQSMADGGVIVDISVDQGGCIETTKPTSWAEPTFIDEGVVHFGVTNMPGSVPRSASQALSAAIIPYALKLTQPQWDEDPGLRDGINVEKGRVVHPALL